MKTYRNTVLFDKEAQNLDDKVKEILEKRELEKEEMRQLVQQKEQGEGF